MAASHTTPLSASGRTVLAELLAARVPHTGGMTLDAAQGFITAALSGPEELPASTWLGVNR